MKHVYTGLVVVVLALLLVTTATAGKKAVVDGVLQIPKASVAPTIDGQLDDVWQYVTALPLLKYESGSTDTSMSWKDHSATFRAMWDDDYFYAFVQVNDDTIRVDPAADPWTEDCVELFFDGDNAKGASYDANDVQWRYVYGEDWTATGNKGNGKGEYAWLVTPTGYNLELRIPKDSLTFTLEADHEIGFEVSNADRDNDVAGRVNVIHWWTTDGNTWQYPNLFGTAVLTNNDAGSELMIVKTTSAPTIDGTMDAGEWDVANQVSLLKFEGDPWPDTIMTTWGDHFTTAYTMWDDNYFYAFIDVTDDTILVDPAADPWTEDCIELFFDGDNAKGASYDANDVQWRYVYGEDWTATGNKGNGKGEYAWGSKVGGYTLELRIPKDSLTFALAADHEIGFEVSNADRDNNVVGRKDVLHWWTTDGNTWQYPNLFGTAVLFDPNPTSVSERASGVAHGFRLDQNYPNPFNPTTKITYSVAKAGEVKLAVYDVLGRQVAMLVNGVRANGTYTVTFDARSISSGMYFYRLEAGNQVFTKKMMLLK